MLDKNKLQNCLKLLAIALTVLIITITPKLGQLAEIVSLPGTVPATVNQPLKDQQWQQVPVGGGGYVTGIYAHPQEADLIYMQTDNGGAYRWLPEMECWQNIIDTFPRLPWNYYGVESLALDPQNPNLIYLALGKYTDGGHGRLWKSSDRGQTWIESDLKVPMGGDEDKRWTGNRLAVSPRNSNVLLFGSRTQGLWRSQDGGLHWSPVDNFGAVPHADLGIIAIAFDPQNAERVYLSAYGDGVYQSDDWGRTWQKIPASPVHTMKMAVATDGSVYVTSDIAPGVSKYLNGTWENITPPGYPEEIYNGLSLDRHDSQRIIVTFGERGNCQIFYSTNGGYAWQQRSAQPQVNPTVNWLPKYFFSDHTSSIIFDPHYPQRVWLADWFGIWRTDNFEDEKPTWQIYPQGQEQLVTFSLLSPPKGATLLSGVADVEGFYHRDLTNYPQDRLSYENYLTWKHRDRYWQDTYDLAYAVGYPDQLVRVGGKRDAEVHMVATSSNGGLTWQQLTTFPNDKIPLQVAISAHNPQNFVIVRSEGQPLQTSDRGQTWQQVSGLPNGVRGPWNWNHSLAADGVNSDRFYYYAGGTVYRSDDGGITFTGVNTSLPSVEHNIMQTIPGRENELWLSLDEGGLWVSHDGGVNFMSLPPVVYSRLISWGKSNLGDRLKFLYLYGEVKGLGEGLFQSSDRGQTWQKLDSIPLHKNDPAKVILVLEASQRETGLVFIGTDGRGIYYRYFEVSRNYSRSN